MKATEQMRETDLDLAEDAERFVAREGQRRLRAATEALQELRLLYPTAAVFGTTER